MRIEVVGRGIDVTDAIHQYAEGKTEKLTKYFDGVQQITVMLTREDHGNHAQFDVELIIDVVHRDDFIARARGDDLYGTIDLAVQKGSRQLTDYKDKLRAANR